MCLSCSCLLGGGPTGGQGDPCVPEQGGLPSGPQEGGVPGLPEEGGVPSLPEQGDTPTGMHSLLMLTFECLWP